MEGGYLFSGVTNSNRAPVDAAGCILHGLTLASCKDDALAAHRQRFGTLCFNCCVDIQTIVCKLVQCAWRRCCTAGTAGAIFRYSELDARSSLAANVRPEVASDRRRFSSLVELATLQQFVRTIGTSSSDPCWLRRLCILLLRRDSRGSHLSHLALHGSRGR